MKKSLSTNFLVAFLSFVAFIVKAETINLYVSPSGNDDWSGRSLSIQAPDGPFLTIGQAQLEVRTLLAESSSNEIIVNIRGGEYFITGPLIFYSEDSGSENNPVVYTAYDDELVIISGGIELTGFNNVTTVEGMNPNAAGNLIHINLKDLGITDYGSLVDERSKMDLLIDNIPMVAARWPNSTLVTYDGDEETVNGIRYDYDRAQNWLNESDLMLEGYIDSDYSSVIYEVSSIDDVNKVITLSGDHTSRSGQRYFVFNTLYELDSPGEWYLNRDSGDLYVWLPTTIEKSPVIQLSSVFNVVNLKDVSWVTFDGIQFSGSRGHSVLIVDGSNIQVKRCKISDSGSGGIVISGGTNHSVIGCDISNTGASGISLTGGDRETLTPNNHLAENNYVHNFARLERSNGPAISLNGVGATARHNTIHNGPHIGLQLAGNNHNIEYNEIFDVTYETEDAGAIYTGRDWTFLGNVIQYNYLHHIVGYSEGINIGVYLDDQAGGFVIKNNLFFKTNFGIYLSGGDDNIIENNTFLATETAVHLDQRGLSWQSETTSSGEQLLEKLEAMPYTSSAWTSAYPEFSNNLENLFAALGNVIKGNTSNSPITLELKDNSATYTTVNDNVINDTMSLSLSNGNISNLSNTEIDLKSFGVYKDIDRVEWPISKYRRVVETED